MSYLNCYFLQKVYLKSFSGTDNLMIHLCLITAISLCFYIVPAHAGRPMIVDDAGIVAANNCQLESWISHTSNINEYWAVPACNLSGNLEVAIGRAKIDSTSQTGYLTFLQGKTLFKPLETNGWGVGLVYGNQSVIGRNGLGDMFATIPVSFSYLDGGLLIHTNLGLMRMKTSRQILKTWGLGTEVMLNDKSTLTAEVFGQESQKPIAQIGMKHWLYKNQIQIDATYGNQSGNSGSGQIVTVGFVLFTDFNE